MQLAFSSLIENGSLSILAACNNEDGGCDAGGGCDVCQSGTGDGCDGSFG